MPEVGHPEMQLGNISIVWNPTAGAPIVPAIKLYRDGQVTDVLKTRPSTCCGARTSWRRRS